MQEGCASEGRALQVLDTLKFVAQFLSRNKHQNSYDSFSTCMTVLGFDLPFLNTALIEQVGRHSIPLPTADEVAKLFEQRVQREKQAQIQPSRTCRWGAGGGGEKRTPAQLEAEAPHYNYGLDLNQCTSVDDCAEPSRTEGP